MYVFGGRGVDGKDLNDLAAFKITSESPAIYTGRRAQSVTFLQISDGSCSRIWVLPRVVGLDMQWLLLAREYLSWVESRLPHQKPTIRC